MSLLSLKRLPSQDIGDGLRFETSVGRVVVLSASDVRDLCLHLPELFPEHFGFVISESQESHCDA